MDRSVDCGCPGCMSEMTHKFLYGKDTEEPGCRMIKQGRSVCRDGCTKQSKHANGECTECKRERLRRQRVMAGVTDKRIKEFEDAISIVANNDLKV